MDTEMDNATMEVCLMMKKCHMADDGKQSMTEDAEVDGIRLEHFGASKKYLIQKCSS